MAVGAAHRRLIDSHILRCSRRVPTTYIPPGMIPSHLSLYPVIGCISCASVCAHIVLLSGLAKPEPRCPVAPPGRHASRRGRPPLERWGVIINERIDAVLLRELPRVLPRPERLMAGVPGERRTAPLNERDSLPGVLGPRLGVSACEATTHAICRRSHSSCRVCCASTLALAPVTSSWARWGSQPCSTRAVSAASPASLICVYPRAARSESLRKLASAPSLVTASKSVPTAVSPISGLRAMLSVSTRGQSTSHPQSSSTSAWPHPTPS